MTAKCLKNKAVNKNLYSVQWILVSEAILEKRPDKSGKKTRQLSFPMTVQSYDGHMINYFVVIIQMKRCVVYIYIPAISLTGIYV